MKTEQRKMKVFIHADKDCLKHIYLFKSDMSDYGYIFLGTDDVVIKVPVIDPVEEKIKDLKKHEEKIRAEFYAKIKDINNSIQSLKAIEYKGDK